MKRGLILALPVAVLLTFFYLLTAIVYIEGEPSEALMLKPFPSVGWIFGGGEEGAWRRGHPQEGMPWWQDPAAPVLASGSPEIAGSQWWELPYVLGLLIVTPLSWLVVTGLVIHRIILRYKGIESI
jgi:hypothetical protein